MDQTLTNKKFIEQMDDVINKLGGTPVDLELTEDREDDMVSNGVFSDKMDEVIEALGGTPSEFIVGDDKADDMVSDNIFQLKMEDMIKNMSGGGGGSSDLSTATVTITKNTNYSFDVALPIVDGDYLYGVMGGDWATGEKQVVLYKNYCEGSIITNATSKIAVTGTGGVTTEGTFVMVAGDGTITITDK